jgi:hypothetical protein
VHDPIILDDYGGCVKLLVPRDIGTLFFVMCLEHLQNVCFVLSGIKDAFFSYTHIFQEKKHTFYISIMESTFLRCTRTSNVTGDL